MGFKENLKSELLYKAMMVKELASITGIKRHTLDNYLNTHNAIPNAEAAVKIAKALGVTVEYLVTGSESYNETALTTYPEDLQSMVKIGSRLKKEDRKLALAILRTIEEHK
jgi:transcriptional regulator with XRE-family HTH domain